MNGQCSWTLDGVRCNKMLDGHDGPHSFTPQSQFRRTTVDAEQQEQSSPQAAKHNERGSIVNVETQAMMAGFNPRIGWAFSMFEWRDDGQRGLACDVLFQLPDGRSISLREQFRSEATTDPAGNPAASPVEDHP